MGSMGTVGDCYDNAPMESFWESMQIELLNRQSWKTVVELSSAMAEWIESFYNPLRRHSALGYLTPNQYEALDSKEPRPHSHKCGPPNGVNRMSSGCRDLNPGPLDPQSSALTKLRHSPSLAGEAESPTEPTKMGRMSMPCHQSFRPTRWNPTHTGPTDPSLSPNGAVCSPVGRSKIGQRAFERVGS